MKTLEWIETKTSCAELSGNHNKHDENDERDEPEIKQVVQAIDEMPVRM